MVTRRQFKTWLLILVAGFTGEITTSWWQFMRAPTDGLRPLFEMSFVSYEADRIAAWLIFFPAATLLALLISSKRIVEPPE
jgi:hypothetical protein